MTAEELAPAIEAIETLEARGHIHGRYYELIRDNALGCEHHRRAYAALVIVLASRPVGAVGRIEMTDEDFARTRPTEFPCTCGCRSGACGRPAQTARPVEADRYPRWSRPTAVAGFPGGGA